MKTLLFSLSLISLLAGCSSISPTVVTKTVEVPILTKCKIDVPEKPVMPITDSSTIESDPFIIVKKSLAEIELRKGYELKLEAAITECNN